MPPFRIALLTILLATAACSDVAPINRAVAPVETPTPVQNIAVDLKDQEIVQVAANIPVARWNAILIAGDNSIQVFDNLTNEFANRLNQRGVISQTLSASTADPARLATVKNIKGALRGITPAAGEGCIIYMTSHGTERGLYLARDPNEFLTPADLAQALDGSCADQPTIVVISACHSGTFLRSGLLKPNRIVLTAARRDRVSFGCGAQEYLTYYDDCFLTAFDHEVSWRGVYNQARSCIAEKETQRGETPSLPQAFFGENLHDLNLPIAAHP